MQVSVNILDRHIQNGTRRSETSCPIALALKDAGFTCVRVNASTISAKLAGKSVLTRLDAKVSAAIRSYDDGFGMAPQTLGVEV